MTITTPLSGTVVVLGLELAMIKLCTQFEIYSFTPYQDMKCDKIQKFRWFGG